MFPRTSRLAVASFILLTASCIRSIDAPECLTLSDCPSGEGYSSCEDGYCFKEGKCALAGFKPGDACCPPVEGDRTGDTDCLVLAEYFGNNLTTPAFDSAGNLFITYFLLDQEKGNLVRLERLTPEDLQSNPVTRPGSVEVGTGESPLPAMITRDETVYASWDGGVKRYVASSLEFQEEIESPAPQGGMAFTANGPRSIVAWPAAGGKVVTYDEDGNTWVVHDVASQIKAPEMTGQRFLAPVASGNGKRIYFVTDGGYLVSMEVGSNPVGVKAYSKLVSPPSGPPIETGGRVFVGCEDGFLRAYREDGGFGFETRWEIDLQGPVAGRPLVDSDGAIVVVLADGRVRVIRDSDSNGMLVAEGDFGREIADVTPLLTDGPRVVALGSGGTSVLTLIGSSEGGTTKFAEGLRFDLDFATEAPPALSGGRIFLPLTTSLRLLAWSLVEELPASGYPREGGFEDNGNQVVLPETVP